MIIISVLVVDDSSFMRKMISSMLEEDPQIKVVATAKNGMEALERVQLYSPQVITMDIEMPQMDGLTALQHIMAQKPTATIMISATTREGADTTLRALEWGAVDFVHKTSGSISIKLYHMKSMLQEKVKIAAQTNITQLVQKQNGRPSTIRLPSSVSKNERFDQLVAIGTSTGGPRALQQVISRLPSDWYIPIVIVQHMPPGFTLSLANRLDKLSHLNVVEAVDGQIMECGTVYIAPGGRHMEVVRKDHRNYYLHLHDHEPRGGGHRPSVDILFESISELSDLRRTLVLLTGMGNDGALGMHRAKQSSNVVTIAESEASCVVYGMPRSAIAMGCVDYVVPLQSIADKMTELARS
jgi:two-component system chemotaxis response regulator CheB